VIVDDDPLMCEVLSALLEDEFEVTTFTSAHAGLATALAGNLDLVLCDVMMPELDGIEFYVRLTTQRPELQERFVFITGGAFTERAREFLKRNKLPILEKPFARADVIRLVRDTLNRARAHGAVLDT
jgi:DNA-binding NtrC family response regulator